MTALVRQGHHSKPSCSALPMPIILCSAAMPDTVLTGTVHSSKCSALHSRSGVGGGHSHSQLAARQLDLCKTLLHSRYVTEADLQFFQEHMEEDVPVPGAGSWVKMCCMELGHLTYTAYRRRLPVRFTLCRTSFVVAGKLCGCKQLLTCSLQHALRLVLVSLRRSSAPFAAECCASESGSAAAWPC